MPWQSTTALVAGVAIVEEVVAWACVVDEEVVARVVDDVDDDVDDEVEALVDAGAADDEVVGAADGALLDDVVAAAPEEGLTNVPLLLHAHADGL